MTHAPEKAQMIRWLSGEMSRATGRRYQIDFDALDLASLREMQRLMRDLESEKDNHVRRARTMPWRR